MNKTTIQKIKAKTIKWGESSKEPMTWQEAGEWCIKQGGRLPSISELFSACCDDVPGFSSAYYWSATTYKSNTANAWNVYFNIGYVNDSNKTAYLNYARCVRE